MDTFCTLLITYSNTASTATILNKISINLIVLLAHIYFIDNHVMAIMPVNPLASSSSQKLWNFVAAKFTASLQQLVTN